METLLVVEDNVPQAELYRQELAEEGYEVIIAHNGSEALKKIEEYSVHLVVLDIRLPGMDGIELLGRILGRDNTMPVIIHSAYARYKEDFMTWTAEHYIVKSSDLSELKARIQQSLDYRKKAVGRS
jgi:DNA-binding response OmpR family regulator